MTVSLCPCIPHIKFGMPESIFMKIMSIYHLHTSYIPPINLCLYVNSLIVARNSRIINITILGIVHRPVFYLKHDVSETGFFLRPKTEASSIYWDQKIQVQPQDEDRIHSPKRYVLNKRQYDG
jgi:hypothetical protein